ncbi:hypothetical protein O181_108083 [Austropuccinia psidii MF-1]|uniref:DUF4219 domain-containing protein n=1 Tax=Austropuccinia psidii MF-1 TaxID=1389203 RepID=A0A9Q3PNI3_9BASI|nr:hypothetical protein [Austropuccinia psidii MF-1]
MSLKTTDTTNSNKDVSTLPYLDGSNFVHWSLKMRIHLRSRDLLDVCEKKMPEDASTSQANKWAKASYEAIDIITTRVVEKVFCEVVNEETFADSYLLWNKIIEKYASKCAVNRGRIWMQWQRFFFDGDLQNYIDNCRKMTMDLYKDRNLPSIKNSTALITNIDEPHNIVYFFKYGRHNGKCTSHWKEECWAENPHLRPNRKNKKHKFYQGSAHLSETQALITTQENQTNEMSSLIVNCGATNHMCNSIEPFVSSLQPISLIVTTGDAKSNLLAEGMGTIEIICNNKKLRLNNCLYIPKLKCDLLSILELFKKKISITCNKNKFVLETHNENLMSGKINNNLMYVDYKIPTCLLSKTIQQDMLWHYRLGNPSSKILKLLSLQNK